jgi:hypothetical protein
MRFIRLWSRVDGDIDLIAIGRMRCVTLRRYDPAGGRMPWDIRQLSPSEPWKRFALDTPCVSIIFENYNQSKGKI